MAKLDSTGGGVALVHREIDNPGEAKDILLQQVLIGPQLGARLAGQIGRRVGLVAGEEQGIAIVNAGAFLQSGNGGVV